MTKWCQPILFKQRINKHREPHCRVISYHRIWYGTASQNSVQEAIETEERNRQPEAGAAPFRKRKNRARRAISRFSVPLLYKLDRRGGVHGVRMFKFTNHARWGIYLLSGGNAQPVRSRRNGFFRLPNGPRTPAWFHSYRPQAALGMETGTVPSQGNLGEGQTYTDRCGGKGRR